MKAIFTTSEGGVAVLTPAPEALQSSTIEDIATKNVPIGTSFEIINNSDLPEDRLFREAWFQNGASIEVDLTKAKEITHERRITFRKYLFSEFTIEDTLQSNEQATKTAVQAILAIDSALITLIDNATTEADLRIVITDSDWL